MVTLQEARQSLQKAEISYKEAEQSLRKQQEEIQSQQYPSRTLRYQQEVISKQPEKYMGRSQQLEAEFEESKRSALSNIFTQQSQLQTYKQKQLDPFKSGLAEAERQQAEIQREQQAYKEAKEVFLGERSIFGLSGKAREYYQSLKSGSRAAQQQFLKEIKESGGKPIYTNGKLVGAEVQTGLGMQSIPLPEFEKGIKVVSEVPSESIKIKSPPSVISLPYTEKERFQQSVSYKGAVSGSLSYVGDLLARKYKEYELKRIEKEPGYRAYQIGGTQRLIKFGTETAPYFTPIGGYVLMAQGTEDLFSPYGKEQRSILKEKGQKWGLGETSSTILSYTPSTLKIGLGFMGTSLYPKTKDLFKTFGRQEVKIESITTPEVLSGQKTFPEAPSSQHLPLFKQGKYSLPGTKPGAYHSTGETFWKRGKIELQPGKSELPGLYGSSSVSPHFLRLSRHKFDLSEYFVGDIAIQPGVAYLQPSGFRFVKAVKIPGVPSKGLGWKWTQPTKPGFADVPGIKSEVEAIFRPQSGDYFKVGKGYFFKWKGRRIPIDVFKSEFSNLGKNIIGKDLKPIKFSKVSGSYVSLPSRYSGQVSKGSLMGLLSSYKTSSKKNPYYFFGSTSSSKKTSKTKRSSLIYGSSRYDFFPPTKTSSSIFSPRSYSRISPYGYKLPPYIPPKKPPVKPPIPRLKLFSKNNKGFSIGRISQKTGYTPSLTGITFGFKTKKKPKELFKGYYGIGIRPVVVSNPLKKKRKTNFF